MAEQSVFAEMLAPRDRTLGITTFKVPIEKMDIPDSVTSPTATP